MIYGTSHFESYSAALKYYKPYGYDNLAINRKISEGEIHIGKPQSKPGEKVLLNHSEGRYFIEEKQT